MDGYDVGDMLLFQSKTLFDTLTLMLGVTAHFELSMKQNVHIGRTRTNDERIDNE